MRDVLGIAQANRHTADRIAAALLAPDPRFGRTTDGRWTVAAPPSEASPALEACRWAVVDVETTGVRAFRGDRIMEIAVVTLDGTVAFHSLVNPGIPIPPFVAGLTGIDAKLVRDAPTFDMIADQLLQVFERCGWRASCCPISPDGISTRSAITLASRSKDATGRRATPSRRQNAWIAS